MNEKVLSKKSLPAPIFTARKTRNLTQTEFGKLFIPPVAQPTVARWERGDLLPDRKHLPKIASLNNLTTEELVKVIEEQRKKDKNIFLDLEEEVFIYDSQYLRVEIYQHKHKNLKILKQIRELQIALEEASY